MKHVNLSIALATGACVAAFTAAPAFAETLKLAHFVPPAHVVTGSVVEPLVEGVSADTNGELTIQVYPGGELGAGPMEQYVRALQGVADITWGLPGYTSSQFPKSMIVEMPNAIPDGMTGYDMLWNAYDAGHLDSEFPGTRPLAIWASEPSVFIMKDHEIRSPEDLQGLKVRVSGSVPGAMITALGGTPVQMPAGEIYNALQTGLIDGVVTGMSAVADFKLDEVANSYTVGAPLGHIMFYLVMNQGAYDALPEDQKAAIDNNSGRGLSRSGEEGWNARARETLEKVSADPDNTVIRLSEEEIAPFDTVATETRDRLIQEMGGEDVYAAMKGGN
ncbi:TRAP transporter substrate-binding protein [Amorphus orientalis]|uniref:TRAP-type C4-dicarboxylate transport system substrate-binding protein n=1 Tax=Amorphus orientalis TaxID=649198 RepID=A0AAE3VL64_9HYPH|nr:TRAP transporter substrate-binding protein [Amorphus orientalis]MDQ0314045.1 TRAP-type C4-dicarboxylate transport system substrate-binding protein [Amorphus orientalis]